jgi:hypothetical protein
MKDAQQYIFNIRSSQYSKAFVYIYHKSSNFLLLSDLGKF